MLHDDVAEAVVVGVPTARRGAVPEAYVVLRPGAEPAFGLAEELKQMVRAKLPAHAVPRVVHVVDALPRTPGGSVRRAALRERRAELVSPDRRRVPDHDPAAGRLPDRRPRGRASRASACRCPARSCWSARRCCRHGTSSTSPRGGSPWPPRRARWSATRSATRIGRRYGMGLFVVGRPEAAAALRARRTSAPPSGSSPGGACSRCSSAGSSRCCGSSPGRSPGRCACTTGGS